MDRMQELYGYLQERPAAEVSEIVRRIRSTDDPLDVLRFIQEGDLLLQRPPPNPRRESHTGLVDTQALYHSSIRVPAEPWTTVAGDGVVSHCISIFFERHQPFLLPIVDQAAFVAQMRAGKLNEASCCSPLLVNAICAHTAITSDYAKALDAAQGGTVKQRFYEEAKRLYMSENGKASWPTAHALMMLFLSSGADASDASGTAFRFAATQMARRLQITRKTASIPDEAQAHQQQRYCSQAAWGMFIMETVNAVTYLQSPLMDVPTIPRLFSDHTDDGHAVVPIPTIPAHVLDAQCDAATILHRLLVHTFDQNSCKPGDPEDLRVRRELYDMLEIWKAALPLRSSYSQEQIRHYYFLRTWYHAIAIYILRPIHHLDVKLPGPALGFPTDLIVLHCSSTLDMLDAWKQIKPSDVDSGGESVLWPLYTCGFTLVPLLDTHPETHTLFTRDCELYFRLSKDWPAAIAMMKGLEAVAHQLNVTLPKDAARYLSDEAIAEYKPKPDLPIQWAVPQIAGLLEACSDSVENAGARIGVELGDVLAKWSSAMTIGS